MRFREGISVGTQPGGRAPRYWIVRRPRSYELDDCPVGVLLSGSGWAWGAHGWVAGSVRP